MHENFKEKIKTQINKNDKTSKTETTSNVTDKLKQQHIDPYNATLRQLFPEHLDDDGCDISLMSGVELELLTRYAKTRRYLLEKYSRTQQETKLHGNVCIEDLNSLAQIDISKAKFDPKMSLLLELNLQLCNIYNKLTVLQFKALEYEKICLRFYSHLTYNWNHAKDIERFREKFWRCKEDVFEIVESYFKICKKYQVITFEKPYYFLTNRQQMDIKLEGDMRRRIGKYSDFEIYISILEGLS